MGSTSKIEILQSALDHNVKFIKSIVNPSVCVSAVIKGNAYGHGTRVVIPELENLGVKHFSVYSSPEASIALRHKAKSSTLMIMGFIYDEDFKWIIENEIEFFVSDLDMLQKAIDTAKAVKKKAIIHLELETGMNRTGFEIKALKKALPILKNASEHIYFKGLASHFAGAESIANYYRIKKQHAVFKKRIKLLEQNGFYPPIKHISSSAATITYPEYQMDLVRTGILVYGYWPTRETFIAYAHKHKVKDDSIRRALRWKSVVSAIKFVPEGEFIGYGLSYQAQHDMQIIIVPVGYSNGYSRSLSNNGHVLVSNQRAAVIGSVNMNMIICDVTRIKDVHLGDEVVLIGKQGDNEISVSSFADMNNAMNYEILARLPENIDRIVV